MATMEKAKPDFADNPAGTTYSEKGTAIAPSGYTGELKNLPQAKKGDKALMYNEDGSLFSPPADADKTLATYKADITGLQIAITKGNAKLATAKEMMAEADEAEKPVFAKSIASQEQAISSNTAAKEVKENELENFRISIITPSQRAVERELSQCIKDRDLLIARIKELEEVKKQWSLPTGSAAASALSASPATEEQKANREKLVTEHGTQGKAIISLLQLGWDNTKIYKHMGIPPASVPGPKNAWKETPAGKTWIAANADLAKSAGLI